MHWIIHMFHTSVVPYISLDRYLNPNLNTIPNMQNMRFFCCSVYLQKENGATYLESAFIFRWIIYQAGKEQS